MGAHMSRLMDVYFMSHLLLGISGHNLKNASACCGGPAVIRHGFKDKANRGGCISMGTLHVLLTPQHWLLVSWQCQSHVDGIIIICEMGDQT